MSNLMVSEFLPNPTMSAPYSQMMPGLPGVSPLMSTQMGQVEPQFARVSLNNNTDLSGSNFNAEAPVFVPRGTSSTEGSGVSNSFGSAPVTVSSKLREVEFGGELASSTALDKGDSSPENVSSSMTATEQG